MEPIQRVMEAEVIEARNSLECKLTIRNSTRSRLSTKVWTSQSPTDEEGEIYSVPLDIGKRMLRWSVFRWELKDGPYASSSKA